MFKSFKRNFISVVTVLISASAVFYTYKSIVVTRNIEIDM